MTREEALARLGLTEGAGRSEIDAAWRRAMKVVHPDRGTAPDSEMAIKLNEARATALDSLTASSGALVPLDQVLELVRAAQAPTEEKKARVARETLDTVVMHHVGELAYRKRQLTVLLGIAGVATALSTSVATLHRFSPVSVAPLFWAVGAATAGLITVLVGLITAGVASRERLLRLNLEEVGETLSDRASYLDTLNEIGLGNDWTRQELHRMLEAWETNDFFVPSAMSPFWVLRSLRGVGYSLHRAVPLAFTAHQIGPVDFGRLLTTKGLELGLIEETVLDSGDEGRRYGFRRTPLALL